MYCRDLGFEGKVVLQYWLLGVRLCHNTVHCIVTEARQGLYYNTVTVPTIQQGHGRWAGAGRACVLGAGAVGAGERRASGRGSAGGRAAGRAAGVGARARGAGGSRRPTGRTGARRWADWALGAGARGLRGRGMQRGRHWQAGRAPGRAWCVGWASWGLVHST